MDKISCIIPVYNAENYLKRCLDTICNQSYPNLEIILVDDGSKDKSGTICDDYSKCYSNVKVIHIENSGASQARRTGLEQSEGDYITFMDSDDYVSPNYVERLYNLLKQFEMPISACYVQRMNEGESEINNNTNNYKKEKITYNKLMPRFFKYEFWALYGKLYKKTIFDSVYFPKATISEDYVVMAQLFCSHKSIAYTDEPLYFYECHPNSLSHQTLSKRAFEEFDNVLYVYDYIKINSPQYTDFAFSNVIETSVKLLSLEERNTTNEFFFYFSRIRKFLRSHFFTILQCRVLLSKIKFLAIALSIHSVSILMVLFKFNRK